METVATIVRRVWLAPGLLPATTIAVMTAWAGTRVAEEALGGGEGFVDEVRAGSLLLAGALVLSLAEPLEVGREARAGVLLLRAAKGGGFALVRRWVGLLLATLPAVALAALAAGGGPASTVALLAQLGVLAAGGLVFGAWLERGLLVPALWLLLVAAYLRPWFVASGLRWAAWPLPALGELSGARGLLHGALWCAAALLVAEWRLRRLVGGR